MFFYDWKFVSFLVLVVIIGSHFLLETRNILAIGRYVEVIFASYFFFNSEKILSYVCEDTIWRTF